MVSFDTVEKQKIRKLIYNSSAKRAPHKILTLGGPELLCAKYFLEQNKNNKITSIERNLPVYKKQKKHIGVEIKKAEFTDYIESIHPEFDIYFLDFMSIWNRKLEEAMMKLLDNHIPKGTIIGITNVKGHDPKYLIDDTAMFNTVCHGSYGFYKENRDKAIAETFLLLASRFNHKFKNIKIVEYQNHKDAMAMIFTLFRKEK